LKRIIAAAAPAVEEVTEIAKLKLQLKKLLLQKKTTKKLKHKFISCMKIVSI
jgi:hypothetical protein